MNKIQISRVDASGFYVEPVLTTQNEIDRHLNTDDADEFTLGKDVVIDSVPEGLHTPKWDGVSWVEGKPNSELVEQAIQAKIVELSSACKNDIIYGFTATNGNGYRLTVEDQLNMQGQKASLDEDTTITEVGWITMDDVQVTHTRDEWLSVYNEAFQHKNNAIWKNKNLRDKAKSATTIEEVKGIAW